MFDEYIEHTSESQSRTQYGLPNVQYEGFETTSYDESDRLSLRSPSSAVFPIEPALPPIFELGRVQYTLPSSLASMDVSSNIIMLALANNSLRQLNLRQPDAIATIALSTKKPAAELSIYKVFLDPTGKHTIITTEQGDNFYSYEGWTKARQLAKWRMVIESVSWSGTRQSATAKTPSTREIILGARNGTVYETVLDAHDDFFKSQDRYLYALFTLPGKQQPVTGIMAETFIAPDNKTRRAAILLTTPTRIYQFTGAAADKKGDDNAKMFEPLFEPYRSTAPTFIEIPGSSTYSELHFYTPPPTLKDAVASSKQLAWLTGSGIYRGTIPLPPTSETLVDSPSLTPYPSSGSGPPDIPLSICLTEFHFILLFRDRLCAISNLDEQLVWEEPLPLKPKERAIALCADPNSNTYWLYTDASLFELVVKDEDRNVWDVYLKRDAHGLALKYAKAASQRAQVYSALGQTQFDQGNYVSAAQSFAQSSTPFEQAALAFSDLGDQGRDGLRTFLHSRLEKCSTKDVIQRMLLATWLVEFYLSKINTLDDIIASERASHDVDNLKTEQAILEDDLRSFFETYKASLDKKTVYDLIVSHGRDDIFLHFANVVGDYDKVLEHHIMDEEWLKAIDILNRQARSPNLEIYYRFSPALMRNMPKETVDAWLRQPALDPLRLVPAILQNQQRSVIDSPLSTNHAIRYLQNVIFTQHSTAPTIHNLFLTLLITSPSVSKPLPLAAPLSKDTSVQERDLPLLRFLSTSPINPLTSKPYYDLDYALRLCKQNSRMQACVHIYAQMAMWDECVELALQIGELELAKVNCERATEDSGMGTGTASSDDDLRKRLWLKVARYVVQDKQDIKTAMQLLDHTPVIKIEDILPFFPDFVVIDDFKDEICTALEGYSAHIESLKAEMDEATRSAESIKADIKNLQNRFVTLEATDKCAICANILLTRQFYVFPCQHCFHADCLIGQVKEYLPAPSLRRLITLQNSLVRMQSAGAPQSAVAAPIPPAQGDRDRPQQPSTPPSVTPRTAPQTQRTLLSSTFNPLDPAGLLINPAVRLANSLNPMALQRNILGGAGAGLDKLKDLVVPDALASAIGAGTDMMGGLPGMGMLWGGSGGKKRSGKGEGDTEKAEKIREEVDELLAASCPLCEGVVVGLDKPFVREGEKDRSWQL
ncbi:hypothetical protein FRB96_002999 [Tulasnella sp. 330]|nr:hypothetical protein FRB96_002999 [Tulasnella sp. 330]